MIGLCHRCEHRVKFLEHRGAGRAPCPRVQCGQTGAVVSCYMYRPVRPLILKKSNDDDPRPEIGPAMLTSRSTPIRSAEGQLLSAIQAGELKMRASSTDDGFVLYWDCFNEHLNRSRELWLPLRYRLHLAYRLNLYRSEKVSIIVRLYYKLLYWKDKIFSKIHIWLVERYDREEEGDSGMPGSKQE